MKSKNKDGLFFGLDYPLIFGVLALSVIGLVFIYSASCYSAEIQFGNAFHYVKTQGVALVLGVFLMFAVAEYLPVEILKKYSYVIFVISVVLLALVFVPFLGIESYGAKRWLNLGFFTIQPSEYAKFGMVVCLASFMARRGADTFPKLLHLMCFGGIVCVLLLLEPNMSITIACGAVLIVMLVVGGAKWKHLLLVGLPVIAAGAALVFSEPYRVRRLLAFIDPWASPLDEGYQLIQSYYALGSGGLFGVGLFNSRQKYLFLPFAESDFVLSVVGEETGLIGVLFVILIFLTVVVRGTLIAMRARDRFSCYLAAGITSVIAVQSVLNIAVVCGAIPPTGLPLPFVSAGGSSLVAFLLAVGVLLRISKNSREKFITMNEKATAHNRVASAVKAEEFYGRVS